jgi:cell division septation protein DedD
MCYYFANHKNNKNKLRKDKKGMPSTKRSPKARSATKKRSRKKQSPLMRALLGQKGVLRLTKPLKFNNPRGLAVIMGVLVVGVAVVAFSSAASATPQLSSGISGKCMDDLHSKSTKGNKVDLYACNGTSAQHWTEQSNGTISLYGKCLDVYQAKKTNGAKLDLYTCNGGLNQRWTFNASHEIISAASGKCIDDPASTKKNGTQLQIWSCHGGPNQEWYKTTYEPVSNPTATPKPVPTQSGGPVHVPTPISTPTPTATPKPTPTPTHTPTPAPTATPTPSPVASGGNCTSPAYTTSSNSSWSNGGYVVQQDMWNNNSGGSQTLYACAFNSWYVTASQPNSGSVKTYPDVYKNYNASVSSFNTLSTSFADVGPHVGIYEFAYDIWINAEAASGATELMIWNDNYNQYPAGSVVATTTIDGVPFQVYRANSNWQIVSFKAVNATITSGTWNLLPFFTYMEGQGWITSSASLKQIAYGTEICSTNSTTQTFKVTNFSITSN